MVRTGLHHQEAAPVDIKTELQLIIHLKKLMFLQRKRKTVKRVAGLGYCLYRHAVEENKNQT
jgi:hypothetical protein